MLLPSRNSFVHLIERSGEKNLFWGGGEIKLHGLLGWGEGPLLTPTRRRKESKRSEHPTDRRKRKKKKRKGSHDCDVNKKKFFSLLYPRRRGGLSYLRGGSQKGKECDDLPPVEGRYFRHGS